MGSKVPLNFYEPISKTPSMTVPATASAMCQVRGVWMPWRIRMPATEPGRAGNAGGRVRVHPNTPKREASKHIMQKHENTITKTLTLLDLGPYCLHRTPHPIGPSHIAAERVHVHRDCSTSCSVLCARARLETEAVIWLRHACESSIGPAS